jgi:hypothetical protein
MDKVQKHNSFKGRRCQRLRAKRRNKFSTCNRDIKNLIHDGSGGGGETTGTITVHLRL